MKMKSLWDMESNLGRLFLINKPFPKCIKSSSILRIILALSNSPHLHKIYLLTVSKLMSMTVPHFIMAERRISSFRLINWRGKLTLHINALLGIVRHVGTLPHHPLHVCDVTSSPCHFKIKLLLPRTHISYKSHCLHWRWQTRSQFYPPALDSWAHKDQCMTDDDFNFTDHFGFITVLLFHTIPAEPQWNCQSPFAAIIANQNIEERNIKSTNLNSLI